MNHIFLSEGLRMFIRNLKVRIKGFREYSGNAKKICETIINDCYNEEKDYFMTSTGHFCEYWTRDFGLCVSALKNLGYKKQIKNTLEYALNIFENKGMITTTITPNGKPFDFPTYAPDSLGFTLHSLITLNNEELVERYKSFLETEAKKFFHKVVDKKTGLVKKKHFSSMKDQSIRKSSCYDNVMCGWVSKNLDELGLENPLKKYDYKQLIRDNFWTGTHFIDDLSGREIVSSDANVFPFWTKLFESEKMINSSVKKLMEKQLDRPFPLKYSIEKPKIVWYDALSKDYQFQNIWPLIALPYIEVVSKVNKKLAKDYLKHYSKMIKKHKTFLEVYTPEGKQFKTAFYSTDEGMLWSAMYLELIKFYS